MHAVTAVMNAYQPSRPCSLDGSRMTSAARSPAWWIVQPIMATATIGSVMALTRKMGRSLRGWMRVKGNWKSQKRKKQSMLELSTPADSGSVFLRLANDGQMAVRQILTPVPPWYVLQREGRQSCSRFGHRGGGRATREDEGSADALDREPEPGDDHARDDGEAREVVAVGGARTDREGNVKASADDTLQRGSERESVQHSCVPAAATSLIELGSMQLAPKRMSRLAERARRGARERRGRDRGTADAR